MLGSSREPWVAQSPAFSQCSKSTSPSQQTLDTECLTHSQDFHDGRQAIKFSIPVPGVHGPQASSADEQGAQGNISTVK